MSNFSVQESSERDKIEISIVDYNINGELELLFSEMLNSITLYYLTMNSLNEIKNTVLNITFV